MHFCGVYCVCCLDKELIVHSKSLVLCLGFFFCCCCCCCCCLCNIPKVHDSALKYEGNLKLDNRNSIELAPNIEMVSAYLRMSINLAFFGSQNQQASSLSEKRKRFIKKITTMQSKITLLVINPMAFICCAWCAVPLYQFGRGVGDSRLINSADPAKTINLQDRYVFFGEEYTHVCVSHMFNIITSLIFARIS